jgi:hypothetical protein
MRFFKLEFWRCLLTDATVWGDLIIEGTTTVHRHIFNRKKRNGLEKRNTVEDLAPLHHKRYERKDPKDALWFFFCFP